MQSLEVSGAARPIYGSLGVKWLNSLVTICTTCCSIRQSALHPHNMFMYYIKFSQQWISI